MLPTCPPRQRPAAAAPFARLLALDASTEALALAVQADGVLQVHDGPGGAQGSAQMLPQARRLLQQARLPLSQLQAIAFGRGPGAFTGLRTACAVAQGLALGAGLPVLPLDSLMIVAEGLRLAGATAATEVDVVMDARMGEVYAGRYRWEGERWAVARAPALHSLDGLHAVWALQPPQCVLGSALAAFGDRLHSGSAQRVGVEIERARALMSLAQQCWRDAGGIDAAEALPLYLRDKVALTVAERDALRRAEAGA